MPRFRAPLHVFLELQGFHLLSLVPLGSCKKTQKTKTQSLSPLSFWSFCTTLTTQTTLCEPCLKIRENNLGNCLDSRAPNFQNDGLHGCSDISFGRLTCRKCMLRKDGTCIQILAILQTGIKQKYLFGTPGAF